MKFATRQGNPNPANNGAQGRSARLVQEAVQRRLSGTHNAADRQLLMRAAVRDGMTPDAWCAERGITLPPRVNASKAKVRQPWTVETETLTAARQAGDWIAGLLLIAAGLREIPGVVPGAPKLFA